MSTVVALALEWMFGDPGGRRHPVAVFGSGASWIEGKLYADSRAAGVLAWCSAVGVGTLVVALLLEGADRIDLSWLAGGLVIWMTVGWRSLLEHVAAVGRAENLEQAREAVARIVGRDVTAMSDADIHRAALESLAENASDAVTAPLFWGAVGGPLGAAAYRWINTLDAMWGYRNTRYGRFGWAAARADDVASWIPARLTAGLYFLAARTWPATGWTREAAAHGSPNAGWPETALAHVLGVRLGGPVRRSEGREERPWMGPEDAQEPSGVIVESGLLVTQHALVLGAALALLAAFSWR